MQERIIALKEENEKLRAENAKLRALDAEYGRVEMAIIIADREFDGNSDHPDCGARLIASIKRLAQDQAQRPFVTRGITSSSLSIIAERDL